jgi:hypothetical protein
VDSIILTPQPDDIPSLLTAMYNINKQCSYLLVSFQLFLIYILFFKLYHPKCNQCNVFPDRRGTHMFHQFGAHFVSDQNIGTKSLIDLKKQLDPKSYK